MYEMSKPISKKNIFKKILSAEFSQRVVKVTSVHKILGKW